MIFSSIKIEFDYSFQKKKNGELIKPFVGFTIKYLTFSKIQNVIITNLPQSSHK